MPNSSRPSRTRFVVLALIIAMLVAGRLLAPPGFMPSFSGGSLALVNCPDADAVSPSTMEGHHHHGDGKGKSPHSPCPYAAIPSLGTMPSVEAPPSTRIVLVAFMLPALEATLLQGSPRRIRPPTRGPPFPR